MVRLSDQHQFPISDGCCAPPLWRGSAFLGVCFGVSPANRAATVGAARNIAVSLVTGAIEKCEATSGTYSPDR